MLRLPSGRLIGEFTAQRVEQFIRDLSSGFIEGVPRLMHDVLNVDVDQSLLPDRGNYLLFWGSIELVLDQRFRWYGIPDGAESTFGV